MPEYLRYSPDVETIEPDEAETHAKIIQVMTEGQNLTREKNDGRTIRISHAKAHGILKGELIVNGDLPSELAQGIFQPGARYDVLVRLSHAPGELTDDSKVSTPRGMAIKVFGVEGEHLPPFEETKTQDFVLDTGKEFINGGAKAFLQAFKPNAKLAPHLSDTTKGVVSTVTRVANTALDTVGLGSAKLDFYGHPNRHPMEEPYYSQTAYRYGDYVAKLGVIPQTPAMKELQGAPYTPETYNAFREATVDYFRSNPAEFEIVVQLNTGLDSMPIEDATKPWSEEESPFRSVARIVLPVQPAYDEGRKNIVEAQGSFSPAHSLIVHRPLGSINRARIAAYTALSNLRRRENQQPTAEPARIEEIPE